MDHDNLRDRLPALHDGELGRKERTELLAHLAACAECRADQERWERVAGAFLRPPPPPTPAETAAFVRRVMARLRPQAPPEAGVPWPGAFIRWMSPALSFGLAMALVFIMWSGLKSAAPTDVLLLINGEASGLARMVSQPWAPTADDMLVMVMGEG